MKTKILIYLCLLSFTPGAYAIGEVLKLNTWGVQYCSGSRPAKFNPSNDLDLWVKMTSDNTATIYDDMGLTSEVGTLDLETSPVSRRIVAFSGFFGDVFDHFVAIGTLNLDASGLVRTVKATVIRRGVLNDCFSRATIKGKRIN